MTFELLGGAGWNVLTADNIIYAGPLGGGGLTSGNRNLLTYEGGTYDVSLIFSFTETFHQVIVADFSVADWDGSSNGEKSFMMYFRITRTAQSLILKVVKVNNDDYKFELITTDILGATEQTDFSDKIDFKWDTIYDALRIISNGSTVTLEVDVGSGFVEQASISTSRTLTHVRLATTDHSDSGNGITYGRVSICHYSSLSERKGVPTITWRTPTAEGSVHSDYIVDSGPQHGRVDDWETPDAMGADVDSITLANEETGKQSYDIGTGGTTTGYTVVGTVGVIVFSYQSVSAASKGGTFFALLVDTTPTEVEIATASFLPDDVLVRGRTDTAPDGGAWTTGDFTGLEIMVKATNGTDGALNAEVNACAIEIYDFPADPPATTFVPRLMIY